MPVAVKLSEHFYRKFGHDLVDEMVNWFNQLDATYRGDLRELNELNFSRFDAQLEQRVTQSEARLERRVTEVKAELQQEMALLRTALADLRADLIKWMFAFWIGQAGLTIGLVLLVIGRR